MLVLFVLMFGVLMGFMALSIDVGLFFVERRNLQNVADAAALAGAQELPEDMVAAEQLAREYAQKNGLDPNSLDVSFECTSEFAVACDPSQNRWDTIVVVAQEDSPFVFATVLSLMGGEDGCWSDACPVSASAAGCRGLCGASPFRSVDVVTILDHTASMSSSDLDNAKAGALALMDYFDADIQRVGLGVTPPVDPTNLCDSINSWGDPKVWVPVPLTFDYQTAVINTECLDRPSFGELTGVHTNLGDPVKAAADELTANGRPDEKWGMILLSDGAANVWDVSQFLDSTGLLSPGAQAPVTSGSGDNNGFDSNPTNALVDGGGYATDNNSGTSTSTSCTASSKDRHIFYDYEISVPQGPTITGIEVRLDAWASGWFFSTRRMCVELSWNNGAAWTAPQQTSNLKTGETAYYVGGPTDTWGHNWSAGALSNANFRVRVTDVASSTSREFFLDWAAVNIYYTEPGGGGGGDTPLGPCDYAFQQAEEAKAAGIELFTIAYGADDYCDRDGLSSPWYGASAISLLQAMATDEFHFFDEPKTADLEPIFQAIGTQLASGSRLVR